MTKVVSSGKQVYGQQKCLLSQWHSIAIQIDTDGTRFPIFVVLNLSVEASNINRELSENSTV